MLTATVGWSSLATYFQDTTSYKTIVRRIAWYLRFWSWLREKKPVNHGITVSELVYAENLVLKVVQAESFINKPENLPRGEAVVIDKGLYCVKTRLTKGNDHTQSKLSSTLLPPKHPIVNYIIAEEHQGNCHAGVQVLMSILRERFWLIRARKTIRAVVAKCTRCHRFDVKKLEAIPAPLPLDRIRMASIFEVTGVDLAGPLFLKGGQKAWIVLFTCAVYRALHLEMVTSLSTEAFLLSLRRFVARRGRPGTIYSDNGTNFVGAENVFSRLDWEKIELRGSDGP
ncbi:unnamed protein product [Allacma fusca]|uniref:Integrase zinc-binding domain-containing protein n=1 Tax=Allacma fusca TaxID=39272 RepID=A0A8J2JFL8_9HEXA|nr:unnamed protein product [Allacma fusca]